MHTRHCCTVAASLMLALTVESGMLRLLGIVFVRR